MFLVMSLASASKSLISFTYFPEISPRLAIAIVEEEPLESIELQFSRHVRFCHNSFA